MTLPADQPENINLLSQLGYRFTLARAPHVTFMTQAVELPGIQLSVAEAPTPFVTIPLSGKVTYDELSINFKVDENMNNYLEIQDWMTQLGSPQDFSGYRELQNAPEGSKSGLTSDLTLSILKSSMTPNLSVVFKDAFPVQVSSLLFNSTDTDVEYLQATVTFRYLLYQFRRAT